MALYTYSFLDVQAHIYGPGGSIELGSGAGVAEEGIDIEASEEIDTMKVAADGTPMHTLNANRSGKVTVRLLKTSPTNAKLSAMYAYQTSSGKLHGANTLTLANSVLGDNINCQAVAFAKAPNLGYDKTGKMVEWEFNAGIINRTLGAGV